MPSLHILFRDVESQITGGEDTGGSFLEAEDTVVIPVSIPVADVAAWLALYDGTQYSPSAGDSRTIARTVLDALSRWNGN